jgi:hypothetical protein
MSHILTEDEVQTVERAIAVGKRHVEIARELNLSVWTIAKISDDLQFEPDPDPQPLVDDAPVDYVALNLRRCPGCGGMIYISPCIACRMAISTRPVPRAAAVDEPQERETRS